jgi:periplasmic protein TonB
MFETTVVISRRRRPRRAFVASLPVAVAAHAIAVVAVFAVDLWDLRLPVAAPSSIASYRMLSAIELPPPPPPPPPAARPLPALTTPGRLPENVAPTVIPDAVPTLDARTPDIVADIHGMEGGVEGGVEGGHLGGIVGGILGGVIADAPPPHTIVVPRDARLPVRPIYMEYPMYPEKWRLQRVEGRVVLRYTIDTRGRVSDVRLLVPAAFAEFSDASVAAIRKWRFHPLEINGEKKEVVHELTISFRIETPQPRAATKGNGRPAVNEPTSQ